MTTYPTTRAVSAPAKHDRLVINGTDVTFFRGKTTPVPSYRLLEPFGYGSATVTIPQVKPYAAHSDPTAPLASGDLAWARAGAFVKIQRIDPDTGARTTDYRGRVISVNTDGPSLVLEVGGLITGPAGNRNHQVPVYRRTKDIGAWMFDSVVNYGNFPGVEFTPRLGPTTGIEVTETGGMSHLAWMQQLCSLAVTKDGDQWTVMPVSQGSKTFEMRHKDATTKHCTIYLDDARSRATLRKDSAEQPNTWFGSGITDDGMIWDGTVLPLVEQGNAPTFPGALSIGDSGEDVVVVNWQLIWAGMLDRQDASPEYDQETADAVERLQDRANLPQTGVVNAATWDALFDVGVLGWDLSGARIMPQVQSSAVREWNYSGTGVRIGRNPDYNPHKLRVDRNIEFGAGVPEKVGIQWMRGQKQRLSGKSWTGSIILTDTGAIAGEHNPGDPAPTSADVLSARDIQAGWNVWLPNFDGGTLVHVADVQVDGNRVTLQVDTHYRDALELSAIRERNRESRRDLRREFIQEYRGSKRIHDAITPFNKKAGLLYHKVTCPANQWTVFPVFAGEAGTVSKLRLTTSPNAEFCSAIFADRINAKTLARRVGNPFPVDADGETVWSNPALDDWFTSRFLLYSHGNSEQPGGYWPKKHTNRDLKITTAPLTGVWQDDASFGYATFEIPALWVAVYPDRDTVIQRGRVLWAQIETGI